MEYLGIDADNDVGHLISCVAVHIGNDPSGEDVADYRAMLSALHRAKHELQTFCGLVRPHASNEIAQS